MSIVLIPRSVFTCPTMTTILHNVYEMCQCLFHGLVNGRCDNTDGFLRTLKTFFPLARAIGASSPETLALGQFPLAVSPICLQYHADKQ